MIFVDVIGGLGNQLFQYAIARSLALSKNTNFMLNLDSFQRGEAKIFDHIKFKLNHFNISEFDSISADEIYRDYDDVDLCCLKNITDTVAEYMRSNNLGYMTDSNKSIRILNKSLDIHQVSIHKSIGDTLFFDEGDNRLISLMIEGYTKIGMNISIEVFLFDANDVLIASYSPTHWEGKSYKFSPGRFVIQEQIQLPETLTSGKYSISIVLSQMNIEMLARIENAALITINDLTSPYTGNSFRHSYYGSLLLHSYPKK